MARRRVRDIRRDDVIEATIRIILRRGFAAARTPRERLEAVVAANFDDRVFISEQCAVWVHFWSVAPRMTLLARLRRINRARVIARLPPSG